MRQRLLQEEAARQCDPEDVRRVASLLMQASPHGAHGAHGARAAEEVQIEIDCGLDVQRVIDPYLRDGNIKVLPDEVRDAVQARVQEMPGQGGVSGRLMALLDALNGLSARLDTHGASRAVLNFGHTSLRSLGSVGLTTAARLAVGRALDLAMQQGTSELVRTIIGAGMMALPVVGQAVLLARDEMAGNATQYSRATRVVLMGLSVGVGGLALGTGTLTNPGLRMAEVVLYPLLRDSMQAVFPMISDPDSSPTPRSLVAAGTAYAANQLGVSRAFVAAPDLGPGGVIPTGVVVRSLANAAGESVDLMSLLYANHVGCHGTATTPRLRIGRDSLREAVRTPLFWDTATARGCFVSAFNQLYDTLLSDHMLPRALAASLDSDKATMVADWATEAIAAGLTIATYPFWTDPLAQRDALPERQMEEGRIGLDEGTPADQTVASAHNSMTELEYVDETTPRETQV